MRICYIYIYIYVDIIEKELELFKPIEYYWIHIFNIIYLIFSFLGYLVGKHLEADDNTEF